MTNKSYSIALLSALLACCAALCAVSMRLEPLYGDLTRIGKFSENDYGFNAPQERMPRMLLDKNSYDYYHDVLVLGDSFSFGHGGSWWENFLAAKTGMTIAALSSYANSPEKVMSLPAYRAAPPKIFIYEVVERNLKGCLKPGPDPFRGRPEPRVRIVSRPLALPSEILRRPLRQSLSEINMAYAANFLWTNLVRTLTGRAMGGAREFKLDRPFFSSRRPDSLLVYRDDLFKKDWTPKDVLQADQGLLRLQDEVQAGGRTLFIALIVPDKLSAYSPYLLDRRRAGLSVMGSVGGKPLNYPRLDLALAAAVKKGVKDVYLPDDSHMSSTGYRIMADTLIRYLRRRGVLIPPR